MATKRIALGEVKVGDLVLTPLGVFKVAEVLQDEDPKKVTLVNSEEKTFRGSKYGVVDVADSYHQLNFTFKVE